MTKQDATMNRQHKGEPPEEELISNKQHFHQKHATARQHAGSRSFR